MKVFTGTDGTGIHVVPNFPKFSVPVLLSYRAYRSVRYRYWCRTELTEVSGTGIDVLPNVPKYPVPVIGGLPWYVPYRTHPSLYAVQKVSFGLSTQKKVKNKNVAPWIWEENFFFAFLRLILTRIPFRASYFGQDAKLISYVVCANRYRLLVRKRTQRWHSGHLFVCSCDSSPFQLVVFA